MDLPTLGAILRYTYNASNSSLSIAYAADPAMPDGWVAWAINPTREGMIGAQALIAFKSKDFVVIKTFNLTSYRSIVESKLSFDVWDLSAEESNGALTIFATVKVTNSADKLNMVWQAGSSVTSGMPNQHDLEDPNLGSKSKLDLDKGKLKDNSVSLTREAFGLWFYVGLLMFLISCVNFGFFSFLSPRWIIFLFCFTPFF